MKKAAPVRPAKFAMPGNLLPGNLDKQHANNVRRVCIWMNQTEGVSNV
jgi:hypothetical protein